MIYRLIAPEWLSTSKKVLEGRFGDDELHKFNSTGYNCYFLPNYPSNFTDGSTVDGSMIDTFRYVMVDMDLKDAVYSSKDEFIQKLKQFECKPTLIVDSGNGVHAYWEVSDLDAMSFLRLARRAIRHFNTDESIATIYRLMRVPGTLNTKHANDFKLCTVLEENDRVYTCDDLDKYLLPITLDDEAYCVNHYNKTYNVTSSKPITGEVPLSFMQLLRTNKEVKELWANRTDDRSKADYRLAHVMYANNLTRDDAIAVLMNSAKASTRADKHRVSYAENIVDKVWPNEQTDFKQLSKSVASILAQDTQALSGTRFTCHRLVDDTEAGFRLGQVIGLVAGSGVGKTSLALNMFKWFVESNPNYIHMFIPLEQPAHEIALRWAKLCGENKNLHDKVHIMDNYNEDKSYRHLSLANIQEYILNFQKLSKHKVGCVVIDHIGVLKKETKNGESQGLIDICHDMKPFAQTTNTMLIMQSQAPREKAGIGDLELDKDAAYGTIFFESYCDYLITLWQPLKRCYKQEGCPTVMAFKFCKIRHKNQVVDRIKEDVRYTIMFDPMTDTVREMTELETKAFTYWNTQATNLRKQDRKTDVLTYESRKPNSVEQSIKTDRRLN